MITDDGLELVKHFEGLYLNAYLDPVKIPTIGFGRIVYPDGTRVKMGDTCTKEQAEAWLVSDLNTEAAHYLRAWVKVEMKPHEWSALCSFVFNRGPKRFKEILPLVNEKKSQEVANSLLTYDWAMDNGEKKVLKGLARRRRAEAKMFLNENWRTEIL